ncbi:hypothetical protein JX266_011971 [Neoarthrinium moseri]|nr:hypothetical protein JX266_011971 [Neoarthrinium moseri]
MNEFSASFFSAKNENTLALANANIDFALVKVEVPKQFKGLEKALTKARRENAEHGKQHRTARRLGALFEQIIPDIDVLSEAYGQRVSEIATSPKFALRSADYGPFASHVGVDGTSIYAAASSSKGGIALHLLACMLARMFSSAEATAIWVQLVESRIKELQETSDTAQLSGMAAMYAVEQGLQIMRDDLANWDASARAWLEAANQVKRKEDTQLKLVIKNIPSINSSGTTYMSITGSWVIAMKTIQNAINGVPQNITNGAVFLAMRCWHLYPNLQVFAPIRSIEFHDPIFANGGTITLGLETKEQDETGVSWSVSLSHLRFYGNPVTVHKSLGVDSDRLTIPELCRVSLGCVISNWTIPSMANIMETADCFVALGEALGFDDELEGSYDADLGWFGPLLQGARSLLYCEEEDRSNAIYLVEYGRRRGRNFLGDELRGSTPMFGLTSPSELFKISDLITRSQHDLEACIRIFRELVEDCGFHENDCVIVSRPPAMSETAGHSEATAFEGTWELVSAREVPRPSTKRSLDGTTIAAKRFVRWVHIDRTRDPAVQKYVCRKNADIFAETSRVIGGLDFMSIDTSGGCSCKYSGHGDYCGSKCPCSINGLWCTSLCGCQSAFYAEFYPAESKLYPVLDRTARCENLRPCRTGSGNPKEDCLWLSNKATLDIDEAYALTQEFKWRDPPLAFTKYFKPNESRSNDPYKANATEEGVAFFPWQVGDNVGLFIKKSFSGGIPGTISLERLTNRLRSGTVNQNLLRKFLTNTRSVGVADFSSSLNGSGTEASVFFTSLKAIAAIRELYSSWTEATLSISITKKPIGMAYWAADLAKTYPHAWPSQSSHREFNRSRKFACLVMAESGVHNLHPDQLDWVVALATANTIYAAEYLLQDPYHHDRSGNASFEGIRRFLGSVGQAGIVLIVPPPSPLILNLDSSKNRFVRADTFSGQLVDKFEQTSLHLRFWELKFPIAIGQGAIDADIVIREGIVSVFDGPRWIADLDVLQGIESGLLVRLVGCTCSEKREPGPLGERLSGILGEQLKSISTWDEMLLCKENLLSNEIGIVRSHGNWSARLAAANLATSLGCLTMVLQSPGACSDCIETLLKTQFWLSVGSNNPYPSILIT